MWINSKLMLCKFGFNSASTLIKEGEILKKPIALCIFKIHYWYYISQKFCSFFSKQKLKGLDHSKIKSAIHFKLNKTSRLEWWWAFSFTRYTKLPAFPPKFFFFIAFLMRGDSMIIAFITFQGTSCPCWYVQVLRPGIQTLVYIYNWMHKSPYVYDRKWWLPSALVPVRSERGDAGLRTA